MLAARLPLPSARRLVALLLLAAGIGCAVPAAAAAHADLESARPAEGSKVMTSPDRVVLTFSETPDRSLSLIRIVNAQGELVAGESGLEAVPGDPLSLQVRLARKMPTGVYSVNWLVVSADDGHVEDGAYAFGVRVVPPPGSTVTVKLDHSSVWTDAVSAAGRWLLYWGLVIMAGAAMTGLVVFRRTASGSAGPAGDEGRLRIPAGGLTILRVSLVAAVAGLVLMTAAERVVVGVPRLLPLFVTSEGQHFLAVGVALARCIVSVVLFDLWPGRWSLAAVGATAAIAMLVHVLGGHADSLTSWRVANIAAQWLHMMAIGAWIGGLAWLLLALRDPDHVDAGAAAKAFSLVATGSLAIVILTGAARGLVELGSPAQVFTSAYGATLGVKVAIVVAIVALGAHNHFRLVPGLMRGDTPYRSFSLNSRGELVLAAAVLLATAVLVGLAPPAS